MSIRIVIYLLNGDVYKYDVKSFAIAENHAEDIVQHGYIASNNKQGLVIYFPASRIAKVKLIGNGIKIAHPYITERV